VEEKEVLGKHLVFWLAERQREVNYWGSLEIDLEESNKKT